MTAIDASPTNRRKRRHEPRTVCLTFGPAADLPHLLRVAADALDVAGAAPTAIAPSTDSEGNWLRVTCEVDPADVATLVGLPALGDHRVAPSRSVSSERCPACELREYLRD